MLLKRSSKIEMASIPVDEQSVQEQLSKEWLLTNDRGGFASGTVVGCNTRKYHGLLVGSLNPPANRIMALSGCNETIIKAEGTPGSGPQTQKNAFGDGDKEFALSIFEFDGRFAGEAAKYLRRFRRDIGVHFDYVVDGLELTKSVYLHPENDVVAIEYDFSKVAEPVEFVVRPLVALRDFHSLQNAYAHLDSTWIADGRGRPNAKDGVWGPANEHEMGPGPGLSIRHNIPHSCELFLHSEDMSFEHDRQWWFNFVYQKEKQRGQKFSEDLWTPGFFKCHIDEPGKIVLWATLANEHRDPQREEMCLEYPNTPESYDRATWRIDSVLEQLCHRQNCAVSGINSKDEKLRMLCLAAQQFVAKRKIGEEKWSTTILAGFPWFVDWGRDSFIALNGLLLTTERFDEARSVLATFADVADKGMIPNRFDDYCSDSAYYNSIDASLWFIYAAFEYLNATGDQENFAIGFLPTIRWIIESYYQGTMFNIHADTDCLITGGDAETQLTWMDAKYEGVAFTPRYGKAVEINALWYNALCSFAGFYRTRDEGTAAHYGIIAEKVAESFERLFWNESEGCLYDCILTDGTVDATIRPNQIFAVSLPFSPLSSDRQKRVVEKIRRTLLTPYGLRSLQPTDSRYKGKYTGSQRERDEAYHQGTVWPHLLGPFVEAYLRVNNFSKKSRKEAFEFIAPLLRHLTEDGCIGSISEIFDGDAPHSSRGCFAQAWAVAELIKAYKLTKE